MSDEPMVYSLSSESSPMTVAALWKEVVRYLAQGSGDPAARRLLEATLVVLADEVRAEVLDD